MRAIIEVGLKDGVLDTQGKAVAGALRGLGFAEVANARVGRIIVLELAETEIEAARARAKAMCDSLLANPVIESYRIRIED